MKRIFILLVLASLFFILKSYSCNRIEGVVEPSNPNFMLPPFKTYKSAPPTQPKPMVKKPDSIFICNSRSARAFHEKYCSGLKRCKADVIKMLKSEAENKGYKSCGYCYGKN